MVLSDDEDFEGSSESSGEEEILPPSTTANITLKIQPEIQSTNEEPSLKEKIVNLISQEKQFKSSETSSSSVIKSVLSVLTSSLLLL